MQENSTAVAAEPTIEHPAWCWPAWCEVSRSDTGYEHGFHFGETRTAGEGSWNEAAVSLVEDPDERGLLVALRIAEPTYCEGITSENKWREGRTYMFEPEDAEKVARWLLKTVGEWREATK